MTDLVPAKTFELGDRTVSRMGYGAMQLAGPGVFGPPRDRAAAIAVLRAAVEAGVNHIDTSDFYGPHVTNQIIREALHPYTDDLVIVTKVGAVRGDDAAWLPAQSPAELTQAVHDNLRKRPNGNAAELRNFAHGLMQIAERDFQDALGRVNAVVSGPKRELWASRNKGWLSDSDLTEVNTLLERLSELTSQPKDEGKNHLVSLVFSLAPIDPRPKRRASGKARKGPVS